MPRNRWISEATWQTAFILAMVAVAAVAAYLAAEVATMFTHDAPTIVLACVLSVWAAEMLVFVVRARFMFARKLRSMLGASPQDVLVERHRMKSRYRFSGVVFAALLGYACYGVYRNVLQTEEAGLPTDGVGVSGVSGALIAKIAVTVVLLAVIVYRIRKK